MRVLFCVDGEAALDGLTGVVRVLVERGHDVDVWLEAFADTPAVAGVRKAGASVGPSARARSDHWFAVMRRVWAARDYVRALDQRWAAMPIERQSAKAAAPEAFTAVIERTPLRFGPARRGLGAALGVLEESQRIPHTLVDGLRRLAPDVVVVTPAVRWGYVQGDYLLAARRLGVRSVVITDGAADLAAGPLLRPVPDAVLVWNQHEVAAATAWHPCPPARAYASGSASLARWTESVPAEDRRAVRRRLGLAEGERFVLYAGSDLGKASGREPELAARLIDALNGDRTEPPLRVLISPHPKWVDGWTRAVQTEDAAERRALVIQASAVIGIHTRLLAEAAVAGRSVVLLSHPDHATVRDGSPRLRSLLDGLRCVESIEDAAATIRQIVNGAETASIADAVWRPAGDPAISIATSIERLVAAPAPRKRGAGLSLAARPVVWAPVAVRQASEARRRLKKEVNRTIRKTRERAARQARRTLRRITEARLATRAFVLGTGEDREVAELEAARVTFEAITEVSRSGKPIIVGPWLSETGFELMYWIPFVRWAKTYGNIREDRLIVLSRGGAAPWYADLTSRYVDLLSIYSVDEFRQRNQARIDVQGGQKQTGRTPFEREMFDRARAAAGVGDAEWLHPSLMYSLFNLFWMQRAPASLIQRFTVHRLMSPPEVDVPPGLPARFVAAKFYTNASFPDSPDNRRFVAHVLRLLTAKHDVVLLNTGITFDDHGEFTANESARLHRIDQLLTPSDNLRLQTRIIGAADAYVGTYGGFSYLAPLCGVNAVTFFSEPALFRHDHLDVAKRVFEELDGGRFIAARTSELDFLQAVLGGGAGAEIRTAVS